MPAPSRLFASALLTVAAAMSGVTIHATVVARVVVGRPGVVATPADLSLLDDLIALAPVFAAFGLAAIAAAIGLLLGHRWADVLGLVVGTIGLAVASFAVVLVVVGRDPLATAVGSPTDGLGILLVAVVVFAAIAAALVVGWGRPAVARRPTSSAA